jgi:hypothetical protein
MKKFIIIMIFGMALPGPHISGQVAINADSSPADSSSMLDVKSSTLGILVPRMTQAQRIAIVKPANGLLVYQTDNTSGFYYNSGSKTDTAWKYLGIVSGPVSDSAWCLYGNEGTDDLGNTLDIFLGTTDNQDLVIKTNSTERLRLKAEGDRLLPNPDNALDLGSTDYAFRNLYLSGKIMLDDTVFIDNPGTKATFIGFTGNSANTGYNNTFLGYHAGKTNTSGYDNLFTGVESGTANSTGFCNSASGFQSLYSNTSGWNNSGFGYGSLYTNSSGMDNSAMGVGALYSNTSGNKNSALGYSALYSNTTGDSNVAIGYLSNVSAGNLSNVVVIGSGAVATTSDQVRLGNSYAKSLFCMGAYTSTTTEVPNLYVSNAGQIIRSTYSGGGGGGGSNLSGTGDPGELTFWTTDSTLSGDTKLFYDTLNNRLGIGTNAPTQQLDITKNMNMPMSSSIAGNLYKNGTLFIHNSGGDNSTNTFLGLNAGNLTLSGYQNTGIGFEVLPALINGNGNTAIGYFSLNLNSGGSENTACGAFCLASNSLGSQNTALGNGALLNNLTGNENTAIGFQSLSANNTGTNNIAIGNFALYNNQSGSHCIAMGHSALYFQSGSPGEENIAIGDEALYNKLSYAVLNGKRNIAIGHQSIYNNIDGYENLAIGHQAMHQGQSGYVNLAIGNYSLENNTGYHNVAIGFMAMRNNSVGIENVVIGSTAMRASGAGVSYNVGIGYASLFNNSGNHNIAIGHSALSGGLGGTGNIAIGSNALKVNGNGDYNIGIGIDCLLHNTSGQYNVAVGYQAMAANLESVANTCIGTYSLNKNLLGINNTASGYASLGENISGSENTATGYSSLYNNTQGNMNTSTGCFSLFNNTVGNMNTAVGYFSMYANNVAQKCVALGYSSLSSQTHGGGNPNVCNTAIGYESLLFTNATTPWDGRENTGVGHQVLLNNTTGYQNTAVGFQSMNNNLTGFYNTTLGYKADVGSNDLVNATAIGANATVMESNMVRIGDEYVGIIEGQVPWSFPSDIRIKKNIQEINHGLDLVMKLNPVEYQTLTDSRISCGFIAQEIWNLFGSEYAIIHVNNDEDRSLSLRITDLIAPMVKAIQEQQEMIVELQKRIEELEER